MGWSVSARSGTTIPAVRMVTVRRMSSLTTPRGPLPTRVYWFRRVMVLAIVFLVVFGSARLLAGSGDEKSGESAAQVSAERAPGTGSTDERTDTDEQAENPPAAKQTKKAKPKKKPKPTPPPLPEPTGVCANDDIVVTPKVVKKRTGPNVRIRLVLRGAEDACTWQVSPSTVTVKIDSGNRDNPDDIWQSRHCPQVIPTKDVTVYAATDTVVPIVWNGRRSDSDCSDTTDWAKLGWYHIKAAAYAGEPTDKQFELTRPTPVTVVKTVEPKPKNQGKKNKNKNKKNRGNAGQPSSEPEPSGAVEPSEAVKPSN